MPRQKNFFVFEVLDPGTEGPLGKSGVRFRWTADAAVVSRPGMREHLSALAKELNALVIQRYQEFNGK